MEIVLGILVLAGLVVYLARRKPLEPTEPQPRLHGSVHFEDRDIERIKEELIR